MSARLVFVLAGWAAACGGGGTPRDGGTGLPQDAALDAPADAAQVDAGAAKDADVDVPGDASRCSVEVCECGEDGLNSALCPPDAPFCCRPEHDTEFLPSRCYPTDDGIRNMGLMCNENPLESAEPSDCREEDVNDEVPGPWIDHPERCSDERPNCCGDPRGVVLCADHYLTGWPCSIGIASNCADAWGTPDSARCPDDHPWCCVSHGIPTCSARLPAPQGWDCDLD